MCGAEDFGGGRCAAVCDDDILTLVCGESCHPGRTELTRRLAVRLNVLARRRILHIAPGSGGTALVLAREYGARVDRVDPSTRTLDRARAYAESAGLADRLHFHHADTGHLPFPDAAFDGVIAECALSAVPDKPTVAAELTRVLRPGGRAGITDFSVVRDHLDPAPAGFAVPVAGPSGACSPDEYASLLTDAGLRVLGGERRDEALAAMIDQIDARLSALLLTPARTRIDAGGVTEAIAAVRTALCRGALGYLLLFAEKR